MSELIRILGLTRNVMSSTVHMKIIEPLQRNQACHMTYHLKNFLHEYVTAQQSESRILNPALSLLKNRSDFAVKQFVM